MQYFRMQFPTEAKPKVVAKSGERDVIVISENAIIVEAKGVPQYNIGASVGGEIYYPNGEKDLLQGYIVFIKGNQVIVKLLKGISLQRMNEQVLWVRKNFPYFDMKMK
ncbi:hypothetical protein [Vibrio sp. 10N.261.46.A3]|uniref:hypothetical protein n=1 Tax=Vibrio sp. 10N.261.46.A3 TaxID=3229658 RepID=UPI003552C19E